MLDIFLSSGAMVSGSLLWTRLAMSRGESAQVEIFFDIWKTFFLLLSYLRYSLYFSFIPFLLLSYLRYLSFLWTSLLTAFIPAMGAMVDDHNPLTGEDFLTFLVPFSNELWAWALLSVLIASKIHFKPFSGPSDYSDVAELVPDHKLANPVHQ